MLSCLESLFEHQPGGVPFDSAVQAIADLLTQHAHQTDFEIDAQATEGIREVYAMVTSLRADFRRVGDSWREADRQLRQASLMIVAAWSLTFQAAPTITGGRF